MKIHIGSQVIDLEQIGNGSYRAVVGFKPDRGTGSLVVTTPLTITMQYETSRKGVARLLAKVELPYSALYPSDTATGSSNLKFSANRSQGVVTAHLVLTLPKNCVDDIARQVAGTTGRNVALGHVATVLCLLRALNPVSFYFQAAEEGVENDLVYDGTVLQAPTLNGVEPLGTLLPNTLDKVFAGLAPTDEVTYGLVV